MYKEGDVFFDASANPTPPPFENFWVECIIQPKNKPSIVLAAHIETEKSDKEGIGWIMTLHPVVLYENDFFEIQENSIILKLDERGCLINNEIEVVLDDGDDGATENQLVFFILRTISAMQTPSQTKVVNPDNNIKRHMKNKYGIEAHSYTLVRLPTP